MSEAYYVLAFDYGTRHIGVAVGQNVTGQASPLTSLRTRQGKPDWDAIGRLIQHWQPAHLVVGLPLYADGTSSPTSLAAERFARQLHGRYRLPVATIDEYLSSYAAAERAPSKQGLDAVAAQVILESWFNRNSCQHDENV